MSRHVMDEHVAFDRMKEDEAAQDDVEDRGVENRRLGGRLDGLGKQVGEGNCQQRACTGCGDRQRVGP